MNNPQEPKVNLWLELVLILAAPVVSIAGQLLADTLNRRHDDRKASRERWQHLMDRELDERRHLNRMREEEKEKEDNDE